MKRPSRKQVIWLVAAAVAVALIVLLSGKKAVPVKAVELKSGELRVVVNATTTSTVKSEDEVTLSAQRTGRVIKLPVEEGDRVKAGALIAQLDLTEEEVQSASAHEQSRATYEEAEKNFKRMEDLFTKGMISQQDLDAVRRTYEVAKSQYRAAAEDVKVKREYSFIRAPFNGVVSKKYTEVGELLTTGKQIATIVNPDRIYVLATIDEVDVGRLRPGQPVNITVDAFPGEKFDGTIKRISPIVTGGKLETRTADVWVYFRKKQPLIKPGMSADVEILVAKLPSVLSVPTQAIIIRDGKKQVYVAEGSALKPGSAATAALKPIDEGESNWSFTEIKGGLKAGEYVITAPDAPGLKDGAKVKIEEK
jgi:RND family efflux transporter MFP subunit